MTAPHARHHYQFEETRRHPHDYLFNALGGDSRISLAGDGASRDAHRYHWFDIAPITLATALDVRCQSYQITSMGSIHDAAMHTDWRRLYAAKSISSSFIDSRDGEGLYTDINITTIFVLRADHLFDNQAFHHFFLDKWGSPNYYAYDD